MVFNEYLLLVLSLKSFEALYCFESCKLFV